MLRLTYNHPRINFLDLGDVIVIGIGTNFCYPRIGECYGLTLELVITEFITRLEDVTLIMAELVEILLSLPGCDGVLRQDL